MKENRILRGTAGEICEIPEPDFGKVAFDEAEGPGCRVMCLHEVTGDAFEGYLKDIAALGYICRECRMLGENPFYAFEKENAALFLVHYPSMGHMSLVGEKDSGYFSWKDRPGTEICQSLLTHIEPVDYGMSYLIRLCDGRFLVLDGGWEFEPDADALMNQLQAQSLTEKPVIALWIFTHPHIDHYRCFLAFRDKYRDRVEIQSFFYNFPEITEELVSRVPRLLEEEETEWLQKLDGYVKDTGVPVIRPHTGQVYAFANARVEVLASTDDACYGPCNVNSISLVLRMEIDGQTLLFCADSEMDHVFLAERYGDYLKCDILQVTHHGFNGGSLDAYKLADPAVCLVPVSEKLFYGTMGVYREENKALVYDLNVQEIITGSTGDHVLPLPYAPKANGRVRLLETAERWQRNLGACSWIFGDMTWDTCRFSVMNLTAFEALVRADLIFEDRSNNIRAIQIKATPKIVKRVNFADPDSIDGDALYFNPTSLAKMGIPEGKTFAVHFMADKPVVIWGEKEPVYVY